MLMFLQVLNSTLGITLRVSVTSATILTEFQKCSGRSNSKHKTRINNIISDCFKELFMLVIALCTACFSKAKINKKNFSSPTSNALAPALG